ncbi:hypothetical protein F52700_8030 [Fusarium sp. NRRL 52700]|nr:hypothetical protein F52700_8030 [Fusarium sp. NRRL 52700]
MKYSANSLLLAAIPAVFASFGAIDVRSVAQVHPAPATTRASSPGLHRAENRFALGGPTLLTCPAPASVTCTPWTCGINSHSDEDGAMKEMMAELLDIFHLVEQLLRAYSKWIFCLLHCFDLFLFKVSILFQLVDFHFLISDKFSLWTVSRAPDAVALRAPRSKAGAPNRTPSSGRHRGSVGSLRVSTSTEGSLAIGDMIESLGAAADIQASTRPKTCQGQAVLLGAGVDINRSVEGEEGQYDGENNAESQVSHLED